jgi:predicted GH43/DUF377 family glycosyl hydrolase
MRRIFDAARTPYKYGVVLRSPDVDGAVDCPSIFRYNGVWYMMYAGTTGKVGYETFLAQSYDLLRWTPVGKVLSFAGSPAWDAWQADGGIALVDPLWGGSGAVNTFEGKYWLSYFGGAQQGYEPDPLSVGIAWSRTPDRGGSWKRLTENPVLAPDQPDARPFEQATLYKSHVLHDPSQTLGFPFVMFYNGKQSGPWIERIGIAASGDMVNWKRLGDGPVIDNQTGISGDPQIVRMGELWVMFYFGAGWKKGAFDTFACSPDLRHWTKWEGPDLVAPGEPWDDVFAHKPWLLKHNGIVYHFYCAVSRQGGRAIALATSEGLCSVPQTERRERTSDERSEQ